MDDTGFTPHSERARRRSLAVPQLIASAALALSTLAIAAAVSINVAHAATPGGTAAGGSLTYVIGTLAGGLGGYAALRALQDD